MRILLIEDEKPLAGYVSRALEKAGHTVQVEDDGARGLAAMRAGTFDLLILDVNLPSVDGLSLLRELREGGIAVHVLILTARSEVGDRVAGLRGGADDYLVKPFAMDELLARVDALGRRGGGQEAPRILQFGVVQLDVNHRRVSCAGDMVELSPREFDVLRVLMEEPGRTFSRDELSERIWERQHEYDTRTVEIFIMRLRKKFEECRNAPTIQTVRGEGYVLRLPDAV
jgi:DNA-binding response OmpR family regulator